MGQRRRASTVGAIDMESSLYNARWDSPSRAYTSVMAAASSRRTQIALALTLLAACLIVGVINQSVLFRSPWGDEASLLRNLRMIGWGGAFFPLPLFDLAAPPGATLGLKAILEVTDYNLPVARLILLLVNCVFIYLSAKALRINSVEIPFILFLCTPQLVYYTTELKHYSFELIASYILIISLAAARRRWELRLAEIAALFLSFGAIIQVTAQSILRVCELDAGRARETTTQKLFDLAVTAAIVLLFFAFGKYLTEQNMAAFNDDAYKNNGFILDALGLGKSVLLAHGMLLLAIGLVVISIALRVFGWRAIISDRLSIFLLLCLVMMSALRLAGLYPAVYPRHIIWIVPLSLFVVAVWLDKLIVYSDRKWLTALPLIGLLLAMVAIGRDPMEKSADNDLFAAMAKLPSSSDVVLNLGAQVALPLYDANYPSLAQDTYYGWTNAVSAPTLAKSDAMGDFAANASKPGAFSSWTYFVLNHDFRPLWRYLLNSGEPTEFYIAISGQTPTGSPVLDDSARAMVGLLKDRGCRFKSAYAGNLVELLSVQCSG